MALVDILNLLQIVNKGRKKFSADFQLMFRLLKLFLFIGSVATLVILFTTLHLTVGDIFQCLLAFLPTGWALLQVQHFPLFANFVDFVGSEPATPHNLESPGGGGH